jgi:hypothetical protein
MTNYDTVMIGFTYDRLKTITESNKPYRGSTNRYPFQYRHQSSKYFFAEVVDGKTEYHVVYGKKWVEVEVTKEEHDKAYALNDGQEWQYRIRGVAPKVYVKQCQAPDVILIVRDDNTVEFTADELHQGTRYFLTDNVRGYFEANCKLGGAVYRNQHDGTTIPIFKGLRLNAQTMEVHESSKYEVRLPRVDRKKSKASVAKYELPLMIAKTMLTMMDFDAFSNELKEATDELDKAFEGKTMWDRNVRSQMQQYALANMDSDPLRSVTLSMVAFDISHARSIASGWSKGFVSGYSQMNMYDAVMTKMKKQTYVKDDTFTYDVVKSGESLTSCGWKTKLFVNGKETKQY